MATTKVQKAEHRKASMRAKVKHPFRVVTRQFGLVKVRFRRLAKNRAHIVTLFALSNLWMVLAKNMMTSVGGNVLVNVLGMREERQLLTGYGAQLMSLKFSRSDESESDLVAWKPRHARDDPRAAITLWKKMSQAGKSSPPQWVSTHPSGTTRIADLQKNLPRVMPLYERAKRK